jgi:hypothetical protein
MKTRKQRDATLRSEREMLRYTKVRDSRERGTESETCALAVHGCLGSKHFADEEGLKGKVAGSIYCCLELNRRRDS